MPFMFDAFNLIAKTIRAAVFLNNVKMKGKILAKKNTDQGSVF